MSVAGGKPAQGAPTGLTPTHISRGPAGPHELLVTGRQSCALPGRATLRPGTGGCALGGLPTGYIHVSLRDNE